MKELSDRALDHLREVAQSVTGSRTNASAEIAASASPTYLTAVRPAFPDRAAAVRKFAPAIRTRL